MSSSDLFTADYPHGTPEGFDDGCRGGSCPGADQWGLSCKRAKQLSRSDYQYQKLIARGLGPAEIADELGLIPEGTPTAPVTKRAPKRKPADRAAAQEESVEVLDDGSTITRTADEIILTIRAEVPDLVPAGPPAMAAIAGYTEELAPAVITQINDSAAELVASLPAEAPDISVTTAPTPKEIRAWAIERGYEVKPRGTLPQHIVDHYWETHDIGADAGTDRTPIKNPEPQDSAGLAASEGPITPTDQTPVNITNPAGIRPDWSHITLTEDLARAQTERDALAEDLAEAQGELTRARSLAARLEEELARSEQTRDELTESLLAAHRTITAISVELNTTPAHDPVTAAHNLRANYLALAEARDRAAEADGNTFYDLNERLSAAHENIRRLQHNLDQALTSLEFTIRQWAIERDRNQRHDDQIEAFRQEYETARLGNLTVLQPITVAKLAQQLSPAPATPNDDGLPTESLGDRIRRGWNLTR